MLNKGLTSKWCVRPRGPSGQHPAPRYFPPPACKATIGNPHLFVFFPKRSALICAGFARGTGGPSELGLKDRWEKKAHFHHPSFIQEKTFQRQRRTLVGEQVGISWSGCWLKMAGRCGPHQEGDSDGGGWQSSCGPFLTLSSEGSSWGTPGLQTQAKAASAPSTPTSLQPPAAASLLDQVGGGG